MSYAVHVRKAAERDVAEAKKWYEDQRVGLATEFYAEFSATLNRLADNPLIYRAVYRNVRRAMLHRFPFLVWYQVQDSYVIVIACTHGRADPRKRPERLR